MKKTGFLILLFTVWNLVAFAQQDSLVFSPKLDFLFYLGEHKQYEDLERYSNSLLNDPSIPSAEFKDSVAFATAEFFNKLHDTLKAVSYYDLVSEASLFRLPAGYFSGLMKADLHRYDEAHTTILSLPEAEEGPLSELKSFEVAGLSLLRRDHAAFDSIQSVFYPTDSTLRAEYDYFTNYRYIQQHLKKKSGFLAGALSAVIPGLGKVYTGYPRQGLASFLKVVPLGVITVENYLHGGFKNPQVYFFGSLFSLFYIGGIWGSTISAQIAYREKNDEIEHNILVGLHIPVDRIFR